MKAFIFLMVIAAAVLLGAGLLVPTSTLDGGTALNIRGIAVDEHTGEAIDGAHIELMYGLDRPPVVDGFSGTDGSFVLFLEHWSFYGYEYFSLWRKYYYYEFSLKVSADGYEERLVEYDSVPRDASYGLVEKVDAGTISLTPSAAAPAE